MAYTANVPQANQQISATQAPILGNFTYINTAMQEDHAWNGNEINSQADGTHQQISLPNQPADITGALPTGIANIEYCIGGNLYSWNGTNKQIVSGRVVSGAVALPFNVATNLTGVVLPNDCIGFAVIRSSNTSNISYSNSFFRTAGTFYSPTAYQQVGSSSAIITIGLSGSQMQAICTTAPGLGSMPFKVVWWPL
jgi:hypothetical protein